MLHRLSERAGLAPAKVNLALHVVGQRADGYHQLETLVAFTDFGDRISIAPAVEPSFTTSGRYGHLIPLDDSNLILRARDLLAAGSPVEKCGPVAISLEKNLPIASGVGGGSSDAAAAAILLSRLWQLDLDEEELRSLTRQLGADVPMCVAARPLIARGTGEELHPVKLPRLHLVLVNPGEPLATPAVFKALERKDNPPLPPLPDLNTPAEVIAWLKTTRNDLEQPSSRLLPSIRTALSELSAEGAELSRMSGSGATCFGLFNSASEAEQAAAAIASRHPSWFVVDTFTYASDEGVSHEPF